MSKILLTNNSEWDSSLRETFSKYGFRENGRYTTGTFLTTYSKRNFDTYNLYENGDDFVACSGTLVYKKNTGETALKEFYNDIKHRSLTEIRADMYGAYVIVYRTEGKISCFVDEMGAYAFYYFENDGQYIFTNTYHHIEKMVRQKVNILAFLEEQFTYCILDNQTRYENIYRILHDEQIVIDLNTNKVSVQPVPVNKYKLKSDSLEDIAAELNSAAAEIVDESRTVLKAPHMFMTGGTDSRLVLANYLHNGISPVACSWYGSPDLMNTKKTDLEIVTEIASGLNLEFKSFDVSGKGGNDFRMIDEEEYDDLGERAEIYYGNRAFRKILENKNIFSSDYGYIGEPLRDLDMLNDVNSSVTLDWFARKYLGRSGFTCINQGFHYYDELLESLKKKFYNIAMKEGIDPETLSREDCMLLYFWYRTHADTVMCNYANNYCYTFGVYLQKKIADLINQVPYKYKENSRLNLKMVELLYPKLLDFRFFSHSQFVVYDKKSGKLIDSRNKMKWINRISSFLQRSALGRKMLSIYRKTFLADHKEKSHCIEASISELKKTKTYSDLKITIDSSLYGNATVLYALTVACNIADIMTKQEKKEI